MQPLQLSRRSSILPLGLFLGLLSSCGAPAAPGRPGPADEVPGTEGRDCEYAALSDSTVQNLAAAAESILPEADPPDETLTLSVRYGLDGRMAWVRAVGDGAAADDLAGRLEDRLADTRSPGTTARVRFTRDRQTEVLPSVLCAPVMRDDPGRAFVQRGGILHPDAVRDRRTMRFTVEVDVGADGRARGARLTRSSATAASLAHDIIQSAMEHEYLPALQDGFPVPGTYVRDVRPARPRRGSG